VSREVRRAPAKSTVSPRPMSVPAKETAPPGVVARRTTTTRPPSSRSVCSTGITASAPRGSMPPVAIDVAVPGATSTFGRVPVAIDSAFTARRTGSLSLAPYVSSARTAKPSMFERSKPGTSTSARTSSASTRPSASASGTLSEARRARSSEACQRRSASSRSSTSRNCCCFTDATPAPRRRPRAALRRRAALPPRCPRTCLRGHAVRARSRPRAPSTRGSTRHSSRSA